ncbi:MAG: recombinase family protein [Chitinophagaceae bacterium]|nr:recombinase family protein [Chitinophagaceae bacterium]
MQIADLYIRVSTDEQADKGYSQRNQEEMLRRFCDFNRISINQVVYEDHSAKTFQRPAWNQLLYSIKKRKHPASIILFTKWDRFSRNAGDAYQMINLLRTYGIEPQAIEQPLDLSIPENKMMLAIYLAAPEVENDRRALNILHGMRRARKEGRYMGKAPVGYINKITEDGKKYITPQEPAASIMKWVFEELSKGQFAVEQIYREALLKGLRCKRTPFWYAIHNPAYCGKVLVSAYKDEPAYYANGQHEPIISESLFNDVQDLLNGKKKMYHTQIGTPDVFHLRGFLLCPKCGKLLTASASKGRSKKYYYYHCHSTCGVRFQSETANDLFAGYLRQLVPHPAAIRSFGDVLRTVYSRRNKDQRTDHSKIKLELDKVNKRLVNARELLLDHDIDPGEYRQIKVESEQKIQLLEAQLFNTSLREKVNIDSLLDRSLAVMSNLEELYLKADTKKKRQLVGSIFPEKLTFDGLTYRTARLNAAVELIYKLGAGLSENKKGENSVETEFSYLVDP